MRHRSLQVHGISPWSRDPRCLIEAARPVRWNSSGENKRGPPWNKDTSLCERDFLFYTSPATMSSSTVRFCQIEITRSMQRVVADHPCYLVLFNENVINLSFFRRLRSKYFYSPIILGTKCLLILCVLRILVTSDFINMYYLCVSNRFRSFRSYTHASYLRVGLIVLIFYFY